MLSNCKLRVEALLHGIAWGMAPIVREEATQIVISAQSSDELHQAQAFLRSIDDSFFVALQLSAADPENEVSTQIVYELKHTTFCARRASPHPPTPRSHPPLPAPPSPTFLSRPSQQPSHTA